MRVWFLAVLIGCDLSAATDKGGDTGVEAFGSDDVGDSGVDDGADDEPDPAEVDEDEDGYTPEDGDCDDEDDTVYPGAIDDCDEVDSDCDGAVDEDAAADDAYEPNDVAPYDLGVLEGDESITIYGFLDSAGDEDRFSFDFSDEWFDFFTVRVQLHPQTSDSFFQLWVEHLETDSIFTDETDGSSPAEFEDGDSFLSADGGPYEIKVSSNGTVTCMDEYKLVVELDALF